MRYSHREMKKVNLQNVEKYGLLMTHPELFPFIEKLKEQAKGVGSKSHMVAVFVSYYFWKQHGILLDERDLPHLEMLDTHTTENFREEIAALKDALLDNEIKNIVEEQERVEKLEAKKSVKKVNGTKKETAKSS